MARDPSRRPASERDFARLLEWIGAKNFSGFPTQYPPLAAWEPGAPPGEPRASWRAARGRGKPLQLYANVPFCATRCAFCFLPVVASEEQARFDRYLDAFEREAGAAADAFAGAEFDNVSVGGGSPTVWDAGRLARLLALLSRFRRACGGQFAFEAHPSQLDAEKISLLRDAGVNWLSLGVQSLRESVAQRADRRQRPQEVLRAYLAAKRAGLRVNMDLMCGLEAQSGESFLEDVRALARLRPDQVHLYAFEANSFTLYRQRGGRQEPADWRAAQALRDRGYRTLLDAGYVKIDDESVALSALAQNRQMSLARFLARAPIVGLGAGAVSYVTGRCRYVNHHNLDAYQGRIESGRPPVARFARLSPDDEQINYALNALVFNASLDGELDAGAFAAEFGAPPAGRLRRALASLANDGYLLERSNGYRTRPQAPAGELFIRRALMSPALVARLRRALPRASLK